MHLQKLQKLHLDENYVKFIKNSITASTNIIDIDYLCSQTNYLNTNMDVPSRPRPEGAAIRSERKFHSNTKKAIISLCVAELIISTISYFAFPLYAFITIVAIFVAIMTVLCISVKAKRYASNSLTSIQLLLDMDIMKKSWVCSIKNTKLIFKMGHNGKFTICKADDSLRQSYIVSEGSIEIEDNNTITFIDSEDIIIEHYRLHFTNGRIKNGAIVMHYDEKMTDRYGNGITVWEKRTTRFNECKVNYNEKAVVESYTYSKSAELTRAERLASAKAI